MIVILNSYAGIHPRAQDRAAVLQTLFAALEVDVRIVQPNRESDLTALARRAAQSDNEVIVAAGGDGTVNTVAGELANTDKILGVLPLGTLNHFAKDLHIPLDLAAAVETIVRGHVMRVDLGEVNGRIFVNNSSLGIYPHIVSKRKVQQQRLGRSKWSAFVWATLAAFRRFPFLNLRIKVEDRELARQTPFLFVGNNEYEMTGLKLGRRPRLNAGCLGLYLTHRTGRFGMLLLAFRALFGPLNQAKDFEAYRVHEAIIDARQKLLLVATDGEVRWIETPLHYRTRPGALRVMTPPSQASN
jgi:diacylglycerol kinase family enzyme